MFHDGWTAAVGAVDVVATLPLDEVFMGKKLWRVADGELCVDNTRTKIGVFVWDQRVRYERAGVEIIFGKIKRPWKYTCFVTGWLRHGARVCWDTSELFMVLQLTTHGGHVGVRVYIAKETFAKVSVQLCGVDAQVTRSFRRAGHSRSPVRRTWEQRHHHWAPLQSICVPTAVMVTLLISWVFLLSLIHI